MSQLTLPGGAKKALDAGFSAAFGGSPTRYFSAPGRTEIGGNHTDHQHGRVLAAAVNLDTRTAVRPNGESRIRVLSQGYAPVEIDVTDLSPRQEEYNSTAALIRGVAAGFAALGCPVAGFDAYVTSTVLPGSGLSSSAALEVLLGTVVNGLFFGGRATPIQVAQIGQQAENTFFGKPCGLMDQMASAVGGLVAMDFEDPARPKVEQVAFDFASARHALCILDSQASHADLTAEYAAIPAEMGAIAAYFGKTVLREVPQEDFEAELPALRRCCGDRAVLRAIHFYRENRLVAREAEALAQGDFDAFLALVRKSGESSFMYLQNVVPAGAKAHQEMALSLALCHRLLEDRGAFRVHGGGFAGTVQAFVPEDLLPDFRREADRVLGNGACHVLSIREAGGVEVATE